MLFDKLVHNGKSPDRAITMVMEKCNEALEHYISIYQMESAREDYERYFSDSSYTSEGFVLNKEEEDYLIKNTQASHGIVGRLVNILKEGWQNLIRWIRTVIEKIKSVFIKRDVQKKLGMIEKLTSKFPKLKNKKIEVPNPKQPLLDKLSNDIKMLKIKIKTGKPMSEIKKDMDDIERRYQAIQNAKNAGMIAVTVGGAIVLLKEFLDFRRLDRGLVENSSLTGVDIENIEYDPERLTMSFKTEKIRMNMEQSKHSNIFSFLKSAPTAIFHAANGMKDISDNGKTADGVLKDLGYKGGIAANKVKKAKEKKAAMKDTEELFGSADELMGGANPVDSLPDPDEFDYNENEVDIPEPPITTESVVDDYLSEFLYSIDF